MGLWILQSAIAQSRLERASSFIDLLSNNSIQSMNAALLAKGFVIDKSVDKKDDTLFSYILKTDSKEKIHVLFEKESSGQHKSIPTIHYWPSVSNSYFALKEEITKQEGYKLKNVESEKKQILSVYQKDSTIVVFGMSNNIKKANYKIVFMREEK
ncbi:hypothetical protein [Sphingobacterium paucimobilis]|nr:hypothetical protein [Sphingobacterium paucimobilis]